MNVSSPSPLPPSRIVDTTPLIHPTLYTAMRRYNTQGTSLATQRSYKVEIRQYTKFCRTLTLSRILPSKRTLLLFSTYWATHYATIRVYLPAVRYAHVTEGCYHTFDSQFTTKVNHLLKGIRKGSAKTKSPRIRLPIITEIIQQIKNLRTKQPTTYQSTMLWAACCVVFFGFLHVSEFTVPSQHSFDQACHLSLADLTLDNWHSPTVVELRIKQSKTDPYRQGASIFLSKTNSTVNVVVKYFIALEKQNGPLFLWPIGTKLTKPIFASALCII